MRHLYHILPSLPVGQRTFLMRDRKSMRARGFVVKDETVCSGHARTDLSMNSHVAVVASIRLAKD